MGRTRKLPEREQRIAHKFSRINRVVYDVDVAFERLKDLMDDYEETLIRRREPYSLMKAFRKTEKEYAYLQVAWEFMTQAKDNLLKLQAMKKDKRGDNEPEFAPEPDPVEDEEKTLGLYETEDPDEWW